MAGEGGEDPDLSIESTPTWVIAAVCTVIVSISLFFERFLHYAGKTLKKKHEKTLYEALLKVKEELMLLGFISLLLMVFQGAIQRICIPESTTHHGLPCKIDPDNTTDFSIVHFDFGNKNSLHILGGARLLATSQSYSVSYHCKKAGKVPLLSLEAIHQLHIFIFVLAITHVVLSLITVVLGLTQISKWNHWEMAIRREDDTASNMIKHVHELKFIQDRFKGFGKAAGIVSRLNDFGKQFYGPITKEDYRTMRLGFIMKHCRGNPKFNFYNYMIRALEADFKKVIGINWYLWAFVIVFLLINVGGWHAYFWVSFIPFVLLFVIGAKLEHIITCLAREVVEKHTAIEGDLIVSPSDHLFWFGKPKIVLFLIHFILFQNAFELSYFFWILTSYGFHSCIMGSASYIFPRLVFSAIVQVVCSYSTLPLYAIVSNMGSSFKKAIFEDHVQECLESWLDDVRVRQRIGTNGAGHENQPKEAKTNTEIEEITTKKIGGSSSQIN
ncbi:MLO-like protein [Rhynchospora pubera]|uniref:MLO-like protein n=1 Tax=Rhynchospora pubera TaxID=906938 RepID=A0AAV8D5Q7_9POAL|nr:MLO-like protein [Rhynchospora pubera]